MNRPPLPDSLFWSNEYGSFVYSTDQMHAYYDLAADEIDRLAAENARLKTSWSTMARVGAGTADLNDKLVAERDALRERVTVLEGAK